ncbi:hypothetical protein ONS95_001345 [Cadophora gregata]|uniref:uncharacterized protein n=1 Tax=Cadophora gregata TaxID=51156 RepID=UPI0026DD7EC9|nr:uncharacterized protein ONS95_001345 [Cadophora gregata]KAK0101841.1 hypothetical protein ONS96_005819 [Cadophora gregata f. sp. sojae]KAK0129423.1 hypothetical protein ONS95_001345 [Cadophora gregata]
MLLLGSRRDLQGRAAKGTYLVIVRIMGMRLSLFRHDMRKCWTSLPLLYFHHSRYMIKSIVLRLRDPLNATMTTRGGSGTVIENCDKLRIYCGFGLTSSNAAEST